MIFTNKGTVNVSGSTPEVMSDLSMIVRSLSKEIDKDLLEKAFNNGFMTDEDREKIAKEFKENYSDISKAFLRMMFGMDE